MSHLGDRLSALVDGELSHDERDRLHAHLAACQDCRAEAAALRALKRRVGALGDTVMDARLLARLFALAEPGEPVPARSRALPGSAAPRPALLMYPDARRCPAGGARGGTRGPARQPAGRAGGRRAGAPHGRGEAWCGRAAAGGLPTWSPASPRSSSSVWAGLSFVVGGGQGAPGPRITPPVEMFTVRALRHDRRGPVRQSRRHVRARAGRAARRTVRTADP